MITLVFLFILAVIVGSVLALDGTGGSAPAMRRPAGLMTWLTSGNWPAKVGAGLVVVGVGALLRYAAINIDLAPSVKLAAGVAAAAVLMAGSLFTGRGAAQRTLSLVLAGAAFGVAYLTAYSAFALFGYLDNPVTGIGLLALVSVAAGLFAVTRGAVSLALLAMVGAYLAPVFATGDPGPGVVYGYYAGISALTLVMVTVRGWRPLIHLSFLFTLAGGLIFAWATRFYTPAHYGVMAPLLLLLAALHVAMPILEQRHTRGAWIDRLDLVYLLALPAVATLLAFTIAPSRLALSWELMGLGAVWLVAAACLRVMRRDGLAAHAIIGIILVGLGAAARFRGLPWELIALTFAVGALAVAVRRADSPRLHSVLAGVVLLLGVAHILGALAPIRDVPVFWNAPFIERLVGAALLIIAGRQCRIARQSLDTLLLAMGIGWGLIAVSAEVIRWDLVSLALFLHWALIAAALSAFFLEVRRLRTFATALGVAIAATAFLADRSADWPVAVFNLCAAPLGLLALALRRKVDEADENGRVAAAIIVPIVAAIWAARVDDALAIGGSHFPLAMSALAAVVTLLAARAAGQRSALWLRTVTPIFGLAFACTLAIVTLVAIQRAAWAIALELICAAGLLVLARISPDRRDVRDWIGPACVIGAALVLQANLLRWLGPPGRLTVMDIGRMQWPTLVSLVWALIGAALTVWGRRSGSRTIWVGGATLLVGAAIKLVLVDFGTLGDLANIIAVIAAGGVFLLVGWLAPIPPAAPASQDADSPRAAPAATTPASAPASAASAGLARAAATAPARPGSPTPAPAAVRTVAAQQASGKTGWTIALIAVGILILSRCGPPVLHRFEQSVNRDQARNGVSNLRGHRPAGDAGRSLRCALGDADRASRRAAAHGQPGALADTGPERRLTASVDAKQPEGSGIVVLELTEHAAHAPAPQRLGQQRIGFLRRQLALQPVADGRQVVSRRGASAVGKRIL